MLLGLLLSPTAHIYLVWVERESSGLPPWPQAGSDPLLKVQWRGHLRRRHYHSEALLVALAKARADGLFVPLSGTTSRAFLRLNYFDTGFLDFESVEHSSSYCAFTGINSTCIFSTLKIEMVGRLRLQVLWPALYMAVLHILQL